MLSLVKFSNISSKGIYVSVIASYNQSSSKNSSYSGCLTYGKCACKTRLKYPFIIFPPYLSKFFLYTITIPYFCKNSKHFYKKFIKNLNFLFLLEHDISYFNLATKFSNINLFYFNNIILKITKNLPAKLNWQAKGEDNKTRIQLLFLTAKNQKQYDYNC
jgi:hypothetical protein